MADKKEKITKEIQLGESKIASRVLVEPWITEDSTRQLEMNKYFFKVTVDATKEQIKQAVQELYKVTVLTVNTINVHRKKKNYGRTPGYVAGYKKAIVKLKKGDSIELIKIA